MDTGYNKDIFNLIKPECRDKALVATAKAEYCSKLYCDKHINNTCLDKADNADYCYKALENFLYSNCYIKE